MSCWVVPSIAADLWGVTVQQILDGVKAGQISSKSDSGFTFIDVAPQSPKVSTPKRFREPTPPTFTVVTSQEITALTGEPDDEETALTADWRAVRSETGHRRRAPLAA